MNSIDPLDVLFTLGGVRVCHQRDLATNVLIKCDGKQKNDLGGVCR